MDSEKSQKDQRAAKIAKLEPTLPTINEGTNVNWHQWQQAGSSAIDLNECRHVDIVEYNNGIIDFRTFFAVTLQWMSPIRIEYWQGCPVHKGEVTQLRDEPMSEMEFLNYTPPVGDPITVPEEDVEEVRREPVDTTPTIQFPPLNPWQELKLKTSWS